MQEETIGRRDDARPTGCVRTPSCLARTKTGVAPPVFRARLDRALGLYESGVIRRTRACGSRCSGRVGGSEVRAVHKPPVSHVPLAMVQDLELRAYGSLTTMSPTSTRARLAVLLHAREVAACVLAYK